MWNEWIEWSNQTSSECEPLYVVLDAGRKLFRISQHNPMLAQVLHNVLKDPQLAMSAVQSEGSRVFESLAATGLIESKDLHQRTILWRYLFAGIMTSLYVLEEVTPAEADVAFGIGLSVWGISETEASKIISRPLSFPLHAID
jgi:hypothetical protein